MLSRVRHATWAKADIALATVEAYGDVKGFAERVGVPFRTITQYRTVAKAWPITSRPVIAFSIAAALMGEPDRYELVESKKWSRNEARALVRERRAAQQALGASSYVAGVIPLPLLFHDSYGPLRADSGTGVGNLSMCLVIVHLCPSVRTVTGRSNL